MSQSDVNRAICRYARQHRLSAYTVRICNVLRFAALRAWKNEQIFRAHQNVE
jgi:hypothetical protein